MKRRDLIGYGIASVSDSGPYNFVLAYLILFLTTIANISPEKAGMVSSVTIIIDGIVGVLVGYISDYTRTKYGRRIPYMFISAFPLSMGLIMLFCTYNVSEEGQTAIYIIAGIMFWAGFSAYYTPYTALGAEITDDYNERSILRTYARYFGLAGNFVGAVFPLLIIEAMTDNGTTEKTAWMIMAIIMAVVSFGSIIATCGLLNGKETKTSVSEDKPSIKKLIKEYALICTLKPFRCLVLIVAAFMIANTCYNSSLVFFVKGSLGLENSITSTVFLVSMIANLVYTPIIGKASVRYGKKHTIAACLLISGAAALVFFFAGICSYPMLMVYVCLFSICYACFWQLINSLMYDLSEVAEYKFEKRIEGSISSVYSLVFTIFTSVATQLFGWVLKFKLVNVAFLLIPGVSLAVAFVATMLYPLDEKRYNKLIAVLEKKRRGEKADITGLERII